MGGAALKNTIFALAQGIDVTPSQPINGAQYGIMGVSFDGTEASVCADSGYAGTCRVNYTPPTIPDSLYTAGYIKSRSYSLYLDDVASGKEAFSLVAWILLSSLEIWSLLAFLGTMCRVPCTMDYTSI